MYTLSTSQTYLISWSSDHNLLSYLFSNLLRLFLSFFYRNIYFLLLALKFPDTFAYSS